MLNLNDALVLYSLIGEYIPEDSENLEMIEFLSKIIEILPPSIYFDIIELISGKNKSELYKMSGIDLAILFTEKLIENQIVSLSNFCRQIEWYYQTIRKT